VNSGNPIHATITTLFREVIIPGCFRTTHWYHVVFIDNGKNKNYGSI